MTLFRLFRRRSRDAVFVALTVLQYLLAALLLIALAVGMWYLMDVVVALLGALIPWGQP